MSIFNKKRTKAIAILTLATGLLLGFTGSTQIYASTSGTALSASQTTLTLMKNNSSNTSNTAKPSNAFKVTLNGTPVTLKSPILVDKGNTLLPVRAISELLGAEVSYDSTNKVAIVFDSTSDTTLEIPLNYSFAVRNNTKQNITGASSVVYDSTTYLPLRFTAEQLGVSINYTSATKTIAITTSTAQATPTPSPTPTATQTPTPAPTATPTKSVAQQLFETGGSINDIPESELKTLTPAQVQALMPNRDTEATTFFAENGKFVEVTMDMTHEYDNYIFNKKSVCFSKISVDLAGSNSVIVFKDGTFSRTHTYFTNGKTLKDIDHIMYSEGSIMVIIRPGVIDLTNLPG